uniref:Claudin 3d n=1 Tax=Scophthalmus maximus TaxID=52904 RepID=A0A8D3BJI9_SCOMX
MTSLADQDTGIRHRTPPTMKNTPAAMATLPLAISSSMQLVHLPPAMASRFPMRATRMETTTRARAACRSRGSASMESYTLHCIWPVYDSMLALPQDLQAARALTVVSIIVGLLALLISIVGAKCTNCIEDEVAKARVMAASGGAFIAAALAQIVPVSWSAHSIIVEFYSPLILSGQKMEIGAALYLGWAAAALLLIGGSILCCSCPPKEEKPTRYTIPPQSRIAYSAAPRSVAQSSYNRKDYV